MRGQPNFKKKIWEFFEQKIEEDATFADEQGSTPLHDAIVGDNFDRFQEIVQASEKSEDKEN